MDLIVSGMALSFQWWPSLTHFEESLAGKRTSFPAMVEQAGEVIYQAVTEARPKPGSKLTIIFKPGQIELGHYLPRLKKTFKSVNQIKAGSAGLYSLLIQAAELIHSDPKHQVVICEMTSTGSAALVLSSNLNMISSSIRLKFADFPDLDPSQADYIVLTDLAAAKDRNAITLQRLYQNREAKYPAAVGSSSNAAALASEILPLIQAVLSIKNQLIPACEDRLELMDTLPSEISLYPIKDFRPWLSRGPDHRRSTLVLFDETQADHPSYIFLEETEQHDFSCSVRIVPESDPYLFPVSGKNENEILTKLISLEKLTSTPQSMRSISDIAYTKLYSKGDRYVLALLAGDRDQLVKEMTHAKTGFTKALKSGESWTSPYGSYFTPTPLGNEGVAFVYPGAFNSYPGMGRELFFSFPGLQEAASQVIPDLSHSLADELLYLRSSQPGPLSDPDQIMADFYQHPNQLIESGISISVLHTLILDQIFDIRPDIALGYSLGETSMLWANRIWQNAQDRSEIWNRSNLFKDQLFGEMKAVRAYWKDRKLGDDFWRSYILKVDRELADSACANEEMAFLSIINTPGEVVIVGEAEACQRVIDKLDCRALPMPFNAVIHNPTMLSTQPAFSELYNIPATPRDDIDFYSAADYQKLTLDQSIIAENMAEMTCNPVDFPRLVNQVYSNGARLFIEVGPQKTCTRWIEKILGGQPHAAIAINKRYQPDLHGILKVIALLLSHQADLDLKALYPAEEDKEMEQISALPLTAQEQEMPDLQNDRQSADPIPENMIKSYFENMDQISESMAQSHQEYLKNQQTLTRNLARLMSIQAGSPADRSLAGVEESALYTKRQITAFTRGDHRICFGNTFSGFGERRIPRLPNGDLQFIDRVTDIKGQPEKIAEGSTLTSEYDIPDQAWYKNGSLRSLPHVSIMELALQPCGFLSAYMGSIKGRENQDLYFRNLDGEATLYSWPTNPTKTITNHVELISSSALDDVIIQKYAFSLSWGSQVFYAGTSSFGYFSLSMLQNQAGLDAGKTSRTWMEDHRESGSWFNTHPSQPSDNSLNKASLPEIERIWISPSGGEYSSGYLFSRMDLNKDAWFYQAHFYQDPVMPGSLGVETMVQALIESTPVFNLPGHYKWRARSGGKVSWKYRGQITPDIRVFDIELHIKSITKTAQGTEISADGMLWKESKPIYKVENITLEAY